MEIVGKSVVEGDGHGPTGKRFFTMQPIDNIVECDRIEIFAQNPHLVTKTVRLDSDSRGNAVRLEFAIFRNGMIAEHGCRLWK